MSKRNVELEFVGCRQTALAMVAAGVFLFGFAAKVGWHVTTFILRRLESRAAKLTLASNGSLYASVDESRRNG